jgi:hypothetical protein
VKLYVVRTTVCGACGTKTECFHGEPLERLGARRKADLNLGTYRKAHGFPPCSDNHFEVDVTDEGFEVPDGAMFCWGES